MRVGLIVYGLDRTLGGISRYTLELARAYENMGSQLEVVLLKAGGIGPLTDTHLQQVNLPGCRLLPGLLTMGHFIIPLLVKRYKLDVIHDPTAVTPLLFGSGGCAVVSTVHDVFPLSYPGFSSTLDTLIYKWWLPYKLPKIDYVLTVSLQSKNDINTYLRVSTDKIKSIYLGVRDLFKPIPPEEALAFMKQRFSVDRPYVLFVGNFTRRKNIELALRGFAQIQANIPDLRFVLVGPRTFKQTPISAVVEELKIAEKVIILGPVEDSALPFVYGGAQAFLFPSFYEGFGLPVLEAMACGTPVITSTSSSLPEVAGKAALLVDPQSVDEMTSALHRILEDSVLRRKLREDGLEQAARFTWEQTAQQTLEVYQRVMR